MNVTIVIFSFIFIIILPHSDHNPNVLGLNFNYNKIINFTATACHMLQFVYSHAYVRHLNSVNNPSLITKVHLKTIPF